MECENCASEILIDSYRQLSHTCDKPEVKKIEKTPAMDRVKLFLARHPTLTGLIILANLPVAIYTYIKLCAISLSTPYYSAASNAPSTYLFSYVCSMIIASFLGLFALGGLYGMFVPDEYKYQTFAEQEIDRWVCHRLMTFMGFWLPVCGIILLIFLLTWIPLYGLHKLFKILHKFLTVTPKL